MSDERSEQSEPRWRILKIAGVIAYLVMVVCIIATTPPSEQAGQRLKEAIAVTEKQAVSEEGYVPTGANEIDIAHLINEVEAEGFEVVPCDGCESSLDESGPEVPQQKQRPLAKTEDPKPIPSSGTEPTSKGGTEPSGYTSSTYRGSEGGIYASTGSGHWISEVSDDGSIITLEDNSLWKVASLDQITSTLWLPVSDIVVMESSSSLGGYRLINKDDDETVEAAFLGYR